MDDDGVRYLYLRGHKEDALVVNSIYNPDIALLWGAAHNVSRHGFEMYLAKYISQNQSLASAFSFQKMLVHQSATCAHV